ncbi:hypothetical protein ACO0QE_004498 [Hanseniaspora vineae]
MSTPQITGKQFINLYRDYLRTAGSFTNYNFKNYFLRKAKRDFRNYKQKALSNSADDAGFNQLDTFSKLRTELAVLKRQSVVSQLYTFDKLVVEPINPHHK